MTLEMTKQEAIELGAIYKTEVEYAVNKIGLTIAEMNMEYNKTIKITVKNEELDLVLGCFSFEDEYCDIDWTACKSGRGFVIYFTSFIPMPFTC